jgi:hypothetical protein
MRSVALRFHRLCTNVRGFVLVLRREDLPACENRLRRWSLAELLTPFAPLTAPKDVQQTIL